MVDLVDLKTKEKEENKPIAQRIIVLGHVRNVGYCEWMLAAANRKDLSGWVRNGAQDSIEALIFGPKKDVESMINACHVGPPAARVKRVKIFHYNESEPTGEFRILNLM